MPAQPYFYRDLTFVSGSADKVREYKALLGIADLRWSNRIIDEPQDASIGVLAMEKLRQLAPQMIGIPYFVEHSGIVIDAWRNLPGGLTRVFLENVGNKGICRMMSSFHGSERTATAIVVIGLRLPDGRERTFEGKRRGRIADEPVGFSNFGWDPIFIPDGQAEGGGKTYGQMTMEEKNRTSMRAEATRQLQNEITSLFRL
jgi:non-canonical purine NTP pyrophosphatase (RdgB/HAM1 family)